MPRLCRRAEEARDFEVRWLSVEAKSEEDSDAIHAERKTPWNHRHDTVSGVEDPIDNFMGLTPHAFQIHRAYGESGCRERWQPAWRNDAPD